MSGWLVLQEQICSCGARVTTFYDTVGFRAINQHGDNPEAVWIVSDVDLVTQGRAYHRAEGERWLAAVHAYEATPCG